MPITFTTGLKPTFPPDSFNSEKEHVRLLGTQLTAGGAFVNPLATVVAALVAKVTERETEALADFSVSQSTTNSLTNFANGTLPQSWQNAASDGQSGYTSNDMSNLASTSSSYFTAITGLKDSIIALKNYIKQTDVDNFKLHIELLSGVDPAPPSGIIKPNLNGLMGLAMAVTDTENRFGVTFTNYLTGLFGTLFTGDTTVINAQAHLDTSPYSPSTYVALNVLTNVTKAYVSGATGDNRVWNHAIASPKISAITTSVTAYKTLVDTHLANLTAHVTTDMAFYNATVDKLEQYVQAYSVSGHIQDPYYRFMYTDVFGSSATKEIITKLVNGEIE